MPPIKSKPRKVTAVSAVRSSKRLTLPLSKTYCKQATLPSIETLITVSDEENDSSLPPIIELSPSISPNETTKNYSDFAAEVPICQSSMRLRPVTFLNRSTNTKEIHHRVVLEMTKKLGSKPVAYDADFGYALTCVMLEKQRAQNGDVYYTRTTGTNCPTLRVIAMRRLSHYVDGALVAIGPCHEPQFSDGETMRMFACINDADFAYGLKPPSGSSAVQLEKIKGAHIFENNQFIACSVLVLRLGEGEQMREFLFEINLEDVRRARWGRLLAAPYTGTVEVHTAYEMTMNDSGYYERGEKVVVLKTLACETKVKAALSSVQSTADLEPLYAQRPSNENPVSEIKAMRFLFDSLKSSQRTAPLTRNVIELLEAAVDTHNLHLVISYFPAGSLLQCLLGRRDMFRRASESEVRVVIRQMAAVLRELHLLGVAYQDLSTENIVVDNRSSAATAAANQSAQSGGPKVSLSDMQFVLIDMGHIAGHDRCKESGRFLPLPGRRRCVGKVIYYCPELCSPSQSADPQPYSGFKVDMWQLGVLMMVLFTGFGPVREDDLQHLRQNLEAWFDAVRRDQVAAFHCRFGTGYTAEGRMVAHTKPLGELITSPQAMDLMCRLLRLDPAQRLTAEEVLAHPWLHEEDQSPHVTE